MDKSELEKLLISLFPGFERYWDREDIHREDDRSFTAHGLMNSFFFYYKGNFKQFTQNELKIFCDAIETIVASDPEDKLDTANAICTSFLELIAGDKEGRALEPYLGKACKEFYAHWL